MRRKGCSTANDWLNQHFPNLARHVGLTLPSKATTQSVSLKPQQSIDGPDSLSTAVPRWEILRLKPMVSARATSPSPTAAAPLTATAATAATATLSLSSPAAAAATPAPALPMTPIPTAAAAAATSEKPKDQTVGAKRKRKRGLKVSSALTKAPQQDQAVRLLPQAEPSAAALSSTAGPRCGPRVKTTFQRRRIEPLTPSASSSQ